MVKKTVGSPEKRLEPSICSASSAPTVMPAARPAPLRICANSRTREGPPLLKRLLEDGWC